MPENTPAAIPFDLDGLADLARQANPDLAKQVDQEMGAPSAPPEAVPSDTPPPEPTPSESAPTEPVVDEAPEPTEPSETEVPSEPKAESSIEDELEELNRQSAAAKSKPTVPSAQKTTPPLAEKPAEPVTNARDSDLKLDERSAATLRPSTKKIIEERNQKIIAERNKAETLAKEKGELEKQLAELKKAPIPKETEEELTQLRERIREMDIARDPSLAKKYDAPVAANQDRIIEVLKEFGLGQMTNGKPDPEAIEKLKQGGLDFKGLAPIIKKLSDAGEEAAAEEIRELLRENIRHGRAKQNEISEWKTNFDAKKQQVQQQTLQQQEKLTAEVREHANRILSEDLEAVAKDFPFVNRPADPLPTDSPAVTKSKMDAIAAYDAAAKSVAEAVARLDPSKVPPDKVAETNGRLTASAVQGIILKQHILPRLVKDFAEIKARNAELEAKFGKIRTAGTLSRAHAAAATAPAGAKAALPESTEDAARQIAKEMGISIG